MTDIILLIDSSTVYCTLKVRIPDMFYASYYEYAGMPVCNILVHHSSILLVASYSSKRYWRLKIKMCALFYSCIFPIIISRKICIRDTRAHIYFIYLIEQRDDNKNLYYTNIR